MDTKGMENAAEDLIAHKLLRAGVLVAKPKVDREGTDLLAFVGISDGAKFCRIQCKGRSLKKSDKAQVRIPFDYVSDAFIVFIFIETGLYNETVLLCFFGKEIKKNWSMSANGKDYILSISKNNLKNNKFAPFIFSENKIHEIKKAIINVDIQGEFKKVIYGYGEGTVPRATCKGFGFVGNC